VKKQRIRLLNKGVRGNHGSRVGVVKSKKREKKLCGPERPVLNAGTMVPGMGQEQGPDGARYRKSVWNLKKGGMVKLEGKLQRVGVGGIRSETHGSGRGRKLPDRRNRKTRGIEKKNQKNPQKETFKMRKRRKKNGTEKRER